MDGFVAREPPPDFLGHQREERCRDLGKNKQGGVEDVERVFVLVPKTLTLGADVPVRDDVKVTAQGGGRAGDVVVVHGGANLFGDLQGTGQEIAVHFR